jgi:hypothetical protein
MSGLLGPVVAQGITPDSGQGQLATAISSFFGAGTPQFSTQAPQAAPPPDNTYDKWGHVVTGSPQGQVAAPAAPAPTVPSLNVGPGLAAPMPPQAAPGAITPGASGYDMWGRQAPPPAQATPQLPGLADILAMIQAEQARQARANQNAPQGLLGGGGNEAGGDQGSADHGGADSGVI